MIPETTIPVTTHTTVPYTGLKILNLSGGGTKIAGIYSAAKNLLERGFKPDIITGVSAGSYLAIPLAMSMFDEAERVLANMTLDTMFDPAPVNNKGKITIASLYRILAGKYYIGDQRKSLELFREAINEDSFKEWKFNEDWLGNRLATNYPDVYVSAVDFRSGSKELFNLRHFDYSQAQDLILGSGSIPFFTKGVDISYAQGDDHLEKFKRQLLFDGGLREHIASGTILDLLLSQNRLVERVISIYARPKDYNISEAEDWFPSDVSTTITRSLDIMGIEISKSNERIENLMCTGRNIKLDQIFLPDIMQGTYDVDKDRLQQYSAAAIFEALKIEI